MKQIPVAFIPNNARFTPALSVRIALLKQRANRIAVAGRTVTVIAHVVV